MKYAVIAAFFLSAFPSSAAVADVPSREAATLQTIAITSLNSVPTPPASEGTSITWTAVATGGTAPLQYRFWRQDGGHWLLARNYGTSNSYTWIPPSGSAGNHAVEVDVRSSGSTKEYEATRITMFMIVAPPTITTLAANRALPLPERATATWIASASGGIAPLQYRFWRQDGGHWILARDYGTANTYSWTAPSGSAGTHAIEVDVRSAQSTRAYDAVRILSFDVASPARVTSLTANLTTPQPAATAITFTATATGGAAPLQYRFWWRGSGGWIMARDYNTSNQFVWTSPPFAAATYTIEADVRSAQHAAVPYESTIATQFSTTAVTQTPVKITSFAANKPSPQLFGAIMLFTATATGGIPPLEWRFWKFRDGTWVPITTWTRDAIFEWGVERGLLQTTFRADVRSAGSTAAYEDTASLPYEIIAPVVTSLTADQATASEGVPITFTATSIGGLAPVEYRYEMYESAVRDWAPEPSFTWTPTYNTGDAYFRHAKPLTVKVRARNAGGYPDGGNRDPITMDVPIGTGTLPPRTGYDGTSSLSWGGMGFEEYRSIGKLSVHGSVVVNSTYPQGTVVRLAACVGSRSFDLGVVPTPVSAYSKAVDFSIIPQPMRNFIVVFAFGPEPSAESLCSATSGSSEAPVWGDGNDLAQIDWLTLLDSHGEVAVSYRTAGTYSPRWVPMLWVLVCVGRGNSYP